MSPHLGSRPFCHGEQRTSTGNVLGVLARPQGAKVTQNRAERAAQSKKEGRSRSGCGRDVQSIHKGCGDAVKLAKEQSQVCSKQREREGLQYRYTGTL